MANDRTPVRRQALAIDPWARWVSGLLGAAGVGSGGAAVFITHVEAGPVALIAGGVLFLFIALGGRMPTRLKIGDNEAAWEGVQDFVERVTDQVPEDQRPEMLSALTELAEVAPAAAGPGLTAAAYHSFIIELLEELNNKRDTGHDILLQASAILIMRRTSVSGPIDFNGKPFKFDGKLLAQGTHSSAVLWIVIRYSARTLTVAALKELAQAATEHREAEPVGLLVITQEPLSPRVEWEVLRLNNIGQVTVRTLGDRDNLSAAIVHLVDSVSPKAD